MKSSILYQGAAILGLALATTQAHAVPESKIDEIVVTATRTETPIEQIGSTVYVVTAKEIELKQKQTVAEVLESIPGISVSRYGGVSGQATSVYIRGSEARHTLVLLNGIPLNDASSPGDEYNFDRINTDSIERIEVLHGAQSTLYGSRAMGGVINIITKKSTTQEIKLKLEAGSFSTFKESVTASGGTSKIQYLFDVSQHNSDGISVARPEAGNPEKDGYRYSSLSTNISITPDRTTDIDLYARYQRSTAEYDTAAWTYPYAAYDSPNYVQSKETTIGINAQKTLFNDSLKTVLSLSENSVSRYYPLDYTKYFEGKTDKYSWVNTTKVLTANEITVGLERTFEVAESSIFRPHHAEIMSIFLQDHISLSPEFSVTAGGRVDDHNKYGSQMTYRIAAAYNFRKSGMLLRSSFGTGFKAPSLSDLYSNYGNPSLAPEESATWDMGIQKNFASYNSKVGVTWFRNDYKNLITKSGATGYIPYNTSIASTYGLEINSQIEPLENLQMNAIYTYTISNDDANKDLAQRPRNRAVISAAYKIQPAMQFGAEVSYIGSSYFDDSHRSKLGSYYIANINGSYNLSKKSQFYARIENLFNRQYEQFIGYNTPGIAGYAGVKVSF